jgi:hypothetical protein
MAVRGACRILLFVFIGLYVLALALFAIGTFGLFGSESGPLAGAFLAPLGLPWNMMLDVFPEAALPWLASASPLVNVCIIYAACRSIGKR